ncbi:MAG: translation initiation factor IF-2 N-terminal domain-containing protein, partial [Pediococcus pentosaceus]|nr:translation initiation factor IF-2 N-terminal domain-containing protein [Pediococcus pentosaceus]MCI1396604.1 translation initiation factor IF-2 N-terminal domain-containing protein [Pediococcus pentosaceus]MCI1472472.1 translation initiation factor IF-2 N-terminal domain-containing protein [Pediococcus pentosaceus]MCI1506816.1 translation initiation factor IF-2 N-terminal domain-containing protein [Pediococcus pentosaceus]MCI1557342.1 translation initiation factor IF-2 N-terminal domain-con
MGKKRIYELAKEINVSSKDIIEKAQADGLDVKNHMSTLDDASEKHLRNAFKKNTTTNKPEEKRTPKFRSSKTGKTVVKKSDHPAADGTKGIQRLKSSNNESTTRNNNNNKNGNQNRNNTNGRPNNNQNRPNNNRNQNNNRNGNRPNQPKRDEKQDRIRASVAEAARMAAQANREIANEKPQANRQRTNSAKPGEQRREGRNNQNRPNNNNRN